MGQSLFVLKYRKRNIFNRIKCKIQRGVILVWGKVSLC